MEELESPPPSLPPDHPPNSKEHPTWTGYYATTDGVVFSNKWGRWHALAHQPDDDGYVELTLCKNGKNATRFLHRFVLETFIGPCPTGMTARHKNNDRADNRLENLAWGTLAEQLADKRDHGKIQYVITPLLIEDVVILTLLHGATPAETAEILNRCNHPAGRVTSNVITRVWRERFPDVTPPWSRRRG